MPFQIRGLDPAPFLPLYGLSDTALAARNARRVVADAAPGYPDRIELRDARPGETLLLAHYEHHPHRTPFRASHAVFVLEGATEPATFVDKVPEPLRIRPISLRAFDRAHDMIDADLIDGADLVPLIERFLARPEVAYLHAHYAKRGCFAALIERA
ncbi:DUF1203 domain-containing protein [Sphingomonas lenta]|uniref:DUF1203 domain-containing protein n=1 Tax=Sphingomonas lenta TaxID=1141887 RepID=A0A2A2SJB8_9SPHN|nr:DUF1203 domain-containing protein [Sphingomonas lenta]PAX09121.1 hypothetical protein CKY28_03995 [Sphingomonas lenta]